MIDPYLLTELVTFAETGTLAKAAEKLNITQPSLTRGMQKLESELNVKLFDRQPNKINLTDTGQYTVKTAKKTLAALTEFETAVHNYDQSKQKISLASTVPGPLLYSQRLDLPETVQIEKNLLDKKAVVPSLLSHAKTIVFSDEELQTNEIESLFLGVEDLYVNLDQFMDLASKSIVSFKDLHDLSFLVLSDIGHWRDIQEEEIPEAKFLYQNQMTNLREISEYSSFPYFTTNLSGPDHQADDNRVRVPISDERAHMPIYASYLISNRSKLKNLLQALQKSWPK
ncbi:LysR family transcriptional regulator [Lactobacillus corticis]|uniref:LysR family transcriptional regulator n=1 Tax=Lactobacillus corticis TaxID=2201249 RepID=A0A916VIC9_9LACO|nr:LysR family transcriptional regulator [Lactobacillus corticis]GFZ27163.1 LysR family transcriptional regulator [Lactobacillus corticis]